MNTKPKTRLQLFVDAMTEKDPFKRLALVQELKKMPKDEGIEGLEDALPEPLVNRPSRPKVVRRH